MNDKLKGIIVCGVVLVCLGGTLAVLKLTGVDTDDGSADESSSAASTSSEEDESVKLVDREAGEIVHITAENEYGTYNYYHDAETGKETTGIEELDGLELNSNKIDDLAEDIAQLTAYKPVEENASDLGKYGLSEPAAKFTVTFSDGSERTFEIGDIAPQNRYRYFKEADSNDVYMVLASTINAYMDRKESFVNTTLLESPEDDESIEFGTLTLSRADLDYDMVFENDNGEYEKSSENMPSMQVMTEPIFSYLNGTTSSDIIYSLYGLTAIEAEVVFPTDEDFAEYGLDEPNATVTFTGEGYDYKLTIGNGYHDVNDDGTEQTEPSAYYCYFTGVEGKDCIWKVDASSLPWTTLKPGDIITTMMTWNMIVDVDAISISGDVNTEFKLTVEADEDGDEDVTEVTQDGKDVDVSLFKSFYQYLLTCPTSDVMTELPNGEPYITVYIDCAEGSDDKIEFYKDTERRTIAVLNEKTPYRIQTNWLDRMLKNAEAVRNGEEIVESY